jgi:hypothetical protein
VTGLGWFAFGVVIRLTGFILDAALGGFRIGEGWGVGIRGGGLSVCYSLLWLCVELTNC